MTMTMKMTTMTIDDHITTIMMYATEVAQENPQVPETDVIHDVAVNYIMDDVRDRPTQEALCQRLGIDAIVLTRGY